MGFFDLFKGKSGPGALKKHAARVATKKSQNADRWQSLIALGELKSPEAVEALLQRFTFRIDPSITDQEEKDLAMQGIVGSGDAAVAPLLAFLAETESIAWPIKMLQKLVPEEEVVAALLDLLEGMNTEYERDPERKIDAIMQLEDYQDPRILPAITRFLGDVNETARFHAVQTAMQQDDVASIRDQLIDTLVAEEGVRVRVAILDGFIKQGWEVGARSADIAANLPTGYVLDGAKVRKR